MSTPIKNLYRSYAYIGILVGIPALATVFALYRAFNGQVELSNVMMALIGTAIIMFGVTIGYHRMLVHKSFEGHPVVKAFFLMLGSMATQGPAISWASVHLKHHAHSDHEGDPHSPNVGSFIHAHFEWMMEMSFEDVYAIRAKYGSRYANDKMVQFFDKTFYLWTIVSLIIPFLIGGWDGLLWGGLVRMFLTSHITWSVNSWCHVAGNRMFQTTDQSRNNWVVGILAMGEGWHNNHHAFPSSAFHGMKWWQVDASAYVIRTLEKLRLAKNVVRIPAEHLERQMDKAKTSARSIQEAAIEKVHNATAAVEGVAETMKVKIEESKENIIHQTENITEALADNVEAVISPKKKMA